MATIEQLQALEIKELKEKVRKLRKEKQNLKTTINRQKESRKAATAKVTNVKIDHLRELIDSLAMYIWTPANTQDQLLEIQAHLADFKPTGTEKPYFNVLNTYLSTYAQLLKNHDEKNKAQKELDDFKDLYYTLEMKHLYLSDFTRDIVQWLILDKIQGHTEDEANDFVNALARDKSEALDLIAYAIETPEAAAYKKEMYVDYNNQIIEILEDIKEESTKSLTKKS